MNRIILLSVDDAWIKRSGETAGASGSAGAVTLRMTFDSAWDGTSKTVYFTDALGENSVKVLLGLDALVTDNTYDVPVPGEAMTQPGQATVTVVGESEGRVITTQAARFRVLDAAIPPSAGNSQPVTPDEAAQLQAQIDALEEIFVTNRQQAQDAAQQAAESAGQAVAAAASIGDAVQRAEAAAGSAQQDASAAQQAEEQAKTAGDAASASAASAAEDAAKAEQAAADALVSKESARGSAQTAESASAQSVQSAQQAAQAASSASADASGAHDSAVSAHESAAVAQEGAQKADSAGKTAQSWAVGGTGTRPGEDADNAKYWAAQAAQAAGGGVISFNGRSGTVMPQTGDYSAEDVGAVPAPLVLTGFQPVDEAGTEMQLQLTEEQYEEVEACISSGRCIMFQGAYLMQPMTKASDSPEFCSPISGNPLMFFHMYVGHTSHKATVKMVVPSIQMVDAGTFQALDTPMAAEFLDAYFDMNMSITAAYNGQTLIFYPDTKEGTTYIFTGQLYFIQYDSVAKTATLSKLGAGDVGAAAASHSHSASDITSGTLSTTRGGTGVTSVGGTDYTTVRFRGSGLRTADTNPTVNGTINWTYG